MKYLKKVIIPVLIDENRTKDLRTLKDMDSLRHAEVHFVHVFNTMTFSFGIESVPLVYPIEADRKMIEESAISLLETITRKVLGESFEGRILHRVLFSDNAKKAFTRYVMDNGPELLIIPTKSKHGIFESSFSAYVNRHTECDVLMLKHKDG